MLYATISTQTLLHSSPLTAELAAFVAVDTKLEITEVTELADGAGTVLGFLTLLRSSKSGLFIPSGNPPGPYLRPR